MLKDFYTSRKWSEFLRVLADERVGDDGYLRCAHCGEPIIKKYDRIGHHKIPLTVDNVNDVNISLNPDNVDFVHHRCHNVIHERFGFDCAKKVYLVYGAPCSGKSTWVLNNAGSDDLIVDIDNIWQMISVNDRYAKPARLKNNVFMIRDCLLDQIRTRYGKWRNAYVITSEPLESQRQRMVDVLGAETVFIDFSREECIARLEKNPNGRDIKLYKDLIERFFENLHQ